MLAFTYYLYWRTALAVFTVTPKSRVWREAGIARLPSDDTFSSGVQTILACLACLTAGAAPEPTVPFTELVWTAEGGVTHTAAP